MKELSNKDTFVAYLMRNPPMKINRTGNIKHISGGTGGHAFHKSIILKMNVIAWIVFELAYYDVVVQLDNHYALTTFFCTEFRCSWVQ